MRTALLFPGQGSQYAGMGKQFHDEFKVARQVFEESNDVLGFDLRKTCFEGSMEELTRTEITQPAILTTSVAIFRVFLQETGISPVIAAGHSLGEISALTCGGVITFRDALHIVRMRGRFMQEAAGADMGAMAAVRGISRERIELVCSEINDSGEPVVISNCNSPVQVVISGTKEGVKRANDVFKAEGGKSTLLKVSAPFHSPLMQGAAERLREVLKEVRFGNFSWPVVSNVTGRPYSDPSLVMENLISQVTSPVKWDESMTCLLQRRVEAAVEIGPGKVLKNLLAENQTGIKGYAYDLRSDGEEFKEKLFRKGSLLDSSFQPTVITRCIVMAVSTRNRNWNDEEYEAGVVKPYREIVRLQEELERDGRQPDVDQMKLALDMLHSVMRTKKMPKEECIGIYDRILRETNQTEVLGEYVSQLSRDLGNEREAE